MRQILIFVGLLSLIWAGCTAEREQNIPELPYIHSDDPVEAGRYLVVIGGCNDCHTDGYLMAEGKIPEEDWLIGSSVGWQGPWGTTYASNLRLRVQEWTEEQWVQTLRSRTGLPPMPWVNVNQMNERDMRAMYTYIKSLGPKGEHTPMAIAPGQIPTTPYLSLFPQNFATSCC
ncbi:MAG: hypothetical protein U5J63_04405 [Fodinibius sp.]|nr:hypothetical protein [Fodinibius sp.]